MSSAYTMPKRPLTWLITGCSAGFGLSLARVVQSHGHNLIATSRNPSRTPELVSEIESKGGKWVKLDVDDPKSAEVIEDLEKSGQEIDVLVNNAGFCIYGAAEQFAEDEVHRLMETLYFGPYRLIRGVLPHMRKRRFGIVVNISSGASLEGTESMGAYAGGKAGLDGLCRVLAKEVAQFNIRVLAVTPGTFNTNLGNAAVLSKTTLPEDYKNTMPDKVMKIMASGAFAPDGDKEKAVKVIYEVVVGEGVGAGHEDERFLPLGRDLSPRVKKTSELYAHSLEVFGEICNNVYVIKTD
ncbi:hypothetical protein F5884DRAFT_714515 [Xylogone sp. PMI_703]|nr:hypothetical protein F5884DRAFT_714515 [Xylogone sp. PMI_703]